VTLDELKAKLNDSRVDPEWKEGWKRRGAHLDSILRCIRDMVGLAEGRLRVGDEIGFQGWCKHILEYAAYKHWDEQAAKPGPDLPPEVKVITQEEAVVTFADAESVYGRPAREGDPGDEDDDGLATWLRFLAGVNPEMTFRQATALFQRRHGYWPRWDWPGLPRSRLDKLARIRDVPMERLIPMPKVRQ
jgi:hypothetical protein